jgi:hypothetical protein
VITVAIALPISEQDYNASESHNDNVWRLLAAGVSKELAEVYADSCNVCKVEALVYARNCPPDTAVRIARY